MPLPQADVNASTRDGSTALLMAAQSGHAEVVELLLRNGAEVDACRDDGATVLQAAFDSAHEPTIELLVRAGAKV